MSIKNPPNWVLSQKLLKDTIVVRKVTITTDPTWGSTTGETTTDYTEKCSAQYVSEEDMAYLRSGEIKVGDLRVFLPIMDDVTDIGTNDRLVYEGKVYSIRTVNRQKMYGDYFWEILARVTV